VIGWSCRRPEQLRRLGSGTSYRVDRGGAADVMGACGDGQGGHCSSSVVEDRGCDATDTDRRLLVVAGVAALPHGIELAEEQGRGDDRARRKAVQPVFEDGPGDPGRRVRVDDLADGGGVGRQAPPTRDANGGAPGASSLCRYTTSVRSRTARCTVSPVAVWSRLTTGETRSSIPR
jgi:hypothetical protein